MSRHTQDCIRITILAILLFLALFYLEAHGSWHR
jgi:hypothetical protein